MKFLKRRVGELIDLKEEGIPLYIKHHTSTENLNFLTLSLFQRLFKGPLKSSGHWTS